MDRGGHRPQTSRELHGGTEMELYSASERFPRPLNRYGVLNITDYSQHVINHSFLHVYYVCTGLSTLFSPVL